MTDVVVVGSGAAGMAAAVSAGLKGASVTVLEKAPLIGGTTSWGGGGIWIPANPWAAAEGHPDTESEALTYLRHLNLGDADLDLAERYVSQAAGVVQSVERHTPLRWNTIQNFPDYHAELPGGKAEGGRSLEIDSLEVGLDILREMRPNPYGAIAASRRELMAGIDATELQRRTERGIVGKGVGVISAMFLTARSIGARVLAGHAVDRLLTRDGAVVGVASGGEEFHGQVVVATGGFERDPALVRAFLRGPMTAPGSPPTNQGDGLKLGMTVGAELGNMSEAWWAPAMRVVDRSVDGQPFYWLLMGAIRATPGGIIVDQRGRRFANEAANYNDFGRSMHEFDPANYQFPRSPSWYVFDAERRHAGPIGPLEPDAEDPDWLVRSPTLEGLAGLLHMRAGRAARHRGALQRPLHHWRRHGLRTGQLCVGPLQRGFHSGDRSATPAHQTAVLRGRGPGRLPGDQGRVEDRPSCARAQSRRVRTDSRACTRPGNAAANPFGMAYPSGGATVGPALVFGWLAGEAAAHAG